MQMALNQTPVTVITALSTRQSSHARAESGTIHLLPSQFDCGVTTG